jgi:hypothetical protein
MMRTVFSVFAMTALLFGISRAQADDGTPMTITGDGVCAKCMLKEAKACQNVVLVQEAGKVVKYYLAKNRVAAEYHEDSGICSATKAQPVKTTAVGTVKEEGGKKVLTATKIEAAQ